VLITIIDLDSMSKFPVKLVLYIQLNKVTGNNLLSHSFLFLQYDGVICTPIVRK
jgi:hypothetical protein